MNKIVRSLALAFVKGVVVVVVLLIAAAAANAQDRIVTTQGKTISCKILSISQSHIRYELQSGQAAVGKFIPIDSVAEYSRSSADSYGDLADTPVRYGARSATQHKRWRLGLQFGGGRMLASTNEAEADMQSAGLTESQASDYAKQYKNGVQFAGELHGMFNDNIGLGLKYQLFYSSASTGDFTASTYNGYINTSVEEKIYLNYVGLSFLAQQWLDYKQRFMLSGQLSMGCAFYRAESKVKSMGNAVGTKMLFAGNLDLSASYYVLPWMSMGVGAGMFLGKANEIELTSGTSSGRGGDVNLWRLDYSLLVRFHF